MFVTAKLQHFFGIYKRNVHFFLHAQKETPLSNKKTLKYLHICKICCTFAHILYNVGVCACT